MSTTVATVTESEIDGVCRVCVVGPTGSVQQATFGGRGEAAGFVLAMLGVERPVGTGDQLENSPVGTEGPAATAGVVATAMSAEDLAEKLTGQVKAAIEGMEKSSLGKTTAAVLREVAEAAKAARVCVSESGEEVNIASFANLLSERADKAEGKHRKLRPV